MIPTTKTIFAAPAAVPARPPKPELILWRTLQGMGGGLLIPLGQALTWPLFQPHERAKLTAAVPVFACLLLLVFRTL